MSFVNLAILGFAAALVVPVMIHLIRWRHQRRPAALGTLRFLREASLQTSARRRLWRWLLLLLRLSLVAAAVLLFARPFLPGAAPPSGREWLVLVDTSGSMNVRSWGNSHFQLAVRWARRLAADLGPDQKLRVWFCGDQVREASAAELDPGGQDLVPAGRVDWPAALRRAAATIAASRAASWRVIVLTDLQRADLPAPDRAQALPRWPAHAALEVHTLVRGEWNAELHAARPGGETATGLMVGILLHGGPPPAAALPLEVWVDGKRAAQTTVAAVSGVVQVPLPLPAAAGDRERMVEIRLASGDALPEDDRFWVALSAPRPAPVWLVAEQGASASRYDHEGYFLKKALEVVPTPGTAAAFAPAFARVVGNDVRPDGSGEAAPRSLVVLADCGAREAAALPALAAAVEAGLGLVVFLGPRADDGACAAALAQTGLLPAAPAAADSADQTRERAVTWWDLSHPTLAAYSLDRMDLASLRLVSRHDLSPSVRAGARALLQLEDDAVSMVETRRGRGRLLVLAASPTRRDSDWVLQRAFAPLVRAWAAHAGAGGEQRDGGWVVVNRRFGDRAGFGPDRSTRRILRFPEREGDLVSASEEQFRAALHLPARPQPLAAATLAAVPAGAAREGELWPWLALALLALAAIEIRLADRRGRRS